MIPLEKRLLFFGGFYVFVWVPITIGLPLWVHSRYLSVLDLHPGVSAYVVLLLVCVLALAPFFVAYKVHKRKL